MFQSQIAIGRGEGEYHIVEEMRLESCDAMGSMRKLQSQFGREGVRHIVEEMRDAMNNMRFHHIGGSGKNIAMKTM